MCSEPYDPLNIQTDSYTERIGLSHIFSWVNCQLLLTTKRSRLESSRKPEWKRWCCQNFTSASHLYLRLGSKIARLWSKLKTPVPFLVTQRETSFSSLSKKSCLLTSERCKCQVLPSLFWWKSLWRTPTEEHHNSKLTPDASHSPSHYNEGLIR